MSHKFAQRVGARPRGRLVGGFSLIELLVAVLVIVLLTSVVSLNVGTGGQSLKRDAEVRHLTAVMGYAQSEAALSGSDFGLFIELVDDSGEPLYIARWLQRFDQGWAEPRLRDDVLTPYTFESGIELSLSLFDNPDVLIATRDPELLPEPQILFFAGGEVTEGELDWIDSQTGELLFRLQWDFFGRTTLLVRGELSDDVSV